MWLVLYTKAKVRYLKREIYISIDIAIKAVELLIDENLNKKVADEIVRVAVSLIAKKAH